MDNNLFNQHQATAIIRHQQSVYHNYLTNVADELLPDCEDDLTRMWQSHWSLSQFTTPISHTQSFMLLSSLVNSLQGIRQLQKAQPLQLPFSNFLTILDRRTTSDNGYVIVYTTMTIAFGFYYYTQYLCEADCSVDLVRIGRTKEALKPTSDLLTSEPKSIKQVSSRDAVTQMESTNRARALRLSGKVTTVGLSTNRFKPSKDYSADAVSPIILISTPESSLSISAVDSETQPKSHTFKNTTRKKVIESKGTSSTGPSFGRGRKGIQKGNQKGESAPTEEIQYGVNSVLLRKDMRGLNIWRNLSSCVVVLPHRDFPDVQHPSSRRPAAVPTYIERQSQPSRDTPEQPPVPYTPPIGAVPYTPPNGTGYSKYDFSEVTQLLHASDYSKIIQLLVNVPDSRDNDFEIPRYFIIGVAYFKMSSYKDAQEHFCKSEHLAGRVNRGGDMMLCYAYLGDIKYSQQEFLIAAGYYKDSIRNFSSSATTVAVTFKLTPPSLSAIHAKCASSFRNLSRMVEAIQHYKKAIRVAEKPKDELSAHTSLGNLYQSMGDNSNALKEYTVSIDLATRLSDYVSLGWAYGNIGNAYLGLNKKDEAIFNLQKSLELAIKYEQTPQAIGRTYNNLGTAYQSMNDLDKAEEYYDCALSQAIYGNDLPGQARVYGNIGNVHMLRKHYKQAIPHYSEVLQLSKDPSTVSTAQHNRGCAYYEWATSKYSPVPCDPPCSLHGPECDTDVCLAGMPTDAKEYYKNGSKDLENVVKYHEEKLQHIKGTPEGLTLSVSLFESNSRTFHRLQDCLVCLHQYDRALVVAEQSRARTLGELMLERKCKNHKQGKDLEDIVSPLSFDSIAGIIGNQQSPLVYLSYTGARLIGWIFVSQSGRESMKTFQVPLSDDQFDGKSFDYFLRYTLTEKLVERSFEMYQSIVYNKESSSSVQMLHDLVATPVLKTMTEFCHSQECTNFRILIVSDSYTSLLPMTCLLDSKGSSFFGDLYSLLGVPSLLTMGIMNQLPDSVIHLSSEPYDFCLIGDPHIPPFILNDDGEIWSLGRLPYARKEVEWIAHALRATAILGQQATKQTLLGRLRSAKIVHIATHGSASAGFLAFSSVVVGPKSGTRQHASADNILLYPAEVEKLNISPGPALVVLSSCDSGRGTVKADGIQGMARAFILAGAQSVLTTLWKVPDESASVFMHFFYQYLLDGLRGSVALRKSILSVRCFAKYSQYIHWSGYQLTGQDVYFSVQETQASKTVRARVGSPSVFPRLSVIVKLENNILKDPVCPTDVQVVCGCPGVEPQEMVVDFINKSQHHFTGGIFWICCHNQELLQESIQEIEVAIGNFNELDFNNQQVLIVLDRLIELPSNKNLLRILNCRSVHILMIAPTATQDLSQTLVKDVDKMLVRGCIIHHIEPLTIIQCTQRIVHSIMKEYELTPTNGDQKLFEEISNFTFGSPILVDIFTQALLTCFSERKNKFCNVLRNVTSLLTSESTSESANTTTLDQAENLNEISDCPSDCDLSILGDQFDSWDSVLRILKVCDLTREETLLLNCLCVFGCTPVPLSIVTGLSAAITRSVHKEHVAGTLHVKLMKHKLVKHYPLPVIIHQSVISQVEAKYIYVPLFLSDCIWKSVEETDRVFALYTSFCILVRSAQSDHAGMRAVLLEAFNANFKLINEDCYKYILESLLL